MNRILARGLLALACAAVLGGAARAEIRTDEVSWTNPKDNTVVPALVFYDPAKARSDGTYPVVMFIHARRGLQEAERKYLPEYAAQGFLVFAPDWQSGRFIEPWPVPHDPKTELDVALGLDFLRTMPRVRPNEKRVLFGYSRGGYYSVRIAAGAVDPRYRNDVACILTIAGHFQNPNAPEPDQVFRYMSELDDISVPILMMIGSDDFSLRVDNNARAFYALVDRDHPAELIILPQARRAFDFREYVEGSTFSPTERAAKRYAMKRANDFMRGCFN